MECASAQHSRAQASQAAPCAATELQDLEGCCSRKSPAAGAFLAAVASATASASSSAQLEVGPGEHMRTALGVLPACFLTFRYCCQTGSHQLQTWIVQAGQQQGR